MQNAAAISTASWISTIRRAFSSGAPDVVAGDLLASLADLVRDVQQRLQLCRDWRGLWVELHRIDERVVALEVMGGRRTVAVATEMAVVP